MRRASTTQCYIRVQRVEKDWFSGFVWPNLTISAVSSSRNNEWQQSLIKTTIEQKSLTLSQKILTTSIIEPKKFSNNQSRAKKCLTATTFEQKRRLITTIIAQKKINSNHYRVNEIKNNHHRAKN